MSQADSIPKRAGQYPNDHCPLCGGDNQCANSAAGDAAAGPPCWCKSVQIPEAVLDCLPEQARGVACICARCAKQAAPTTVPGVHQIVDQGQRPALQLAANGQRVLISLTGAQVLSWHTEHGDVLWTASEPKYEAGKPVRGGVPLVFPWFGDHRSNQELPAHGFARSVDWQCVDQQVSQVTLQTSDTEATRKLWNHAFLAELTVALGETLGITMTVTNTGDDTFSFEQALHTYFAAGDIHEASVHGLENVTFLEHAREPEGEWDHTAALRFRAETDRVFQDVPDELSLHAKTLGRTVTLHTSNSRSTIVWNPWPTKTVRLSQMQAHDWRSFCCIESANVGDHAITLAPGTSHEMSLTLRTSQDDP